MDDKDIGVHDNDNNNDHDNNDDKRKSVTQVWIMKWILYDNE